jgi:hypothetical protein
VLPIQNNISSASSAAPEQAASQASSTQPATQTKKKIGRHSWKIAPVQQQSKLLRLPDALLGEIGAYLGDDHGCKDCFHFSYLSKGLYDRDL